MNDEDTILNAIIVACIVGIAVIIFLIVTTDGDERFTELYLLDYDKSPPDGVVSLRYGIANHENRDVNYTITIMMDNETQRSKEVLVPDNNTHIDEYFFAVDTSIVHKVMVRLDGREEEVHFFTEAR
ncbi:MAG: DUF1616 domain-containing protein [archaeon]